MSKKIPIGVDSFRDFSGSKPALWSLSLAIGYLKLLIYTHSYTDYQCELDVSNKEAHCLYQSIFSRWVTERLGSNFYAAYNRTAMICKRTDDLITHKPLTTMQWAEIRS